MSRSSSGRAMSSTDTSAEPVPFASPTAALAGFVHELRARGVPVSTGRFHAFVAALNAVDLTWRDTVDWTGRCTLCSSPDHLAIYDEVFARWFEGRGAELQHQPRAVEEQVVLGMHAEDESEADEERVDVPTEASAVEVLRRRDLAEMTSAELEAIHELLEALPWETEQRATRRRLGASTGIIDRRRSVRTGLRSAGELQELRYSRRRIRPRRVVLLIDVSGSMQEYADPFLRFAHVAVRRLPGPTEAFALGTRLTRLTPQLNVHEPGLAMRQAAEVIEDWHGGTRLGEGVKAFLDQWGQRGTARGAVAVVFSDGWERGDPAALGRQVARLSRLTHRTIWANPRKARPGYEPLVGGIAASLPHVDHFVDCSRLAALSDLVRLIGVTSNRRR